jgi:hypothetical protein
LVTVETFHELILLIVVKELHPANIDDRLLAPDISSTSETLGIVKLEQPQKYPPLLNPKLKHPHCNTLTIFNLSPPLLNAQYPIVPCIEIV